jgi:hypothetical protein
MSAEAMQAKRTVMAVASRMPQLGRDFYTHGPKRGLALLTAYLEKACAAGTLRITDRELAAAQFIELATAGQLRRRFFDDQVPEPTEEEIRVTVESAVWLFLSGYGVES